METKMAYGNSKLNRDVIKYIAMLTMLLNHISQVFMKSGYFLSELFLDIGYFTAITMCYFLVEGFQYTHSKKNYAIRLLIFALISEIPYCMAFTTDGVLEFQGLNMLFTLLICFMILIVNDKVSNKFLKDICILGLIILSLFCDWALLAPIFTLLFIWSRGLRNKMTREYLKLEAEGASFEQLENLTLGGLRKAVVEGDTDNGSVLAGQIAGMITKRQSCQEIVDEVMDQAERLLKIK